MLRRERAGRTTDEIDDSHVLLVINGTLDPADVVLAGRGNSTRSWTLAWDSTWETPAERDRGPDGRGTSLAAGVTVQLEPLSIQVYLAYLDDTL